MRGLHLERTGLMVVDAQQGFTELCPDELPVAGALGIVPAVNRLLSLPWARVDASADWHPPDHCSFIGRPGGLFPRHCVRGTPGADFLPGLHTESFQTIWRKGFRADQEAYALTAQHPAFVQTLRASGITACVICGIATNICCFLTGRDLRLAGFDVIIVEDACAGIDVPSAGLYQAAAKAEGTAMGIRYCATDELFGALVPQGPSNSH